MQVDAQERRLRQSTAASLKKLLRARTVAAVSLTVLLSACLEFRGELSPTVPAIPDQAFYDVDMALLFSPEFQNREAIYSWQGDSYIYPVGEASINLIEETLRGAFRNVVRISVPEGSDGSSLGRPVIVSEISDVQLFYGRPAWKDSSAEVTYAFSLRDRTGRELAAWQVSGVSVQEGMLIGKLPPVQLTRAVEGAMSAAAGNLLESLTVFPDVREALEALEES